MTEYTGTFEPANALAGVTGAIYYAPFGTAFPDPLDLADTGLTDWGATWKSLGTFNPDGVEHEFSEDIQEVPSWQKGIVRVIVKGRTVKLKLTALESRIEVIQQYYGEEFVMGGSFEYAYLDINPTTPRTPCAYGFEWVDTSTGGVWRLKMPRAQAGNPENSKFNGEVLSWGMSVSALGSSSTYVAQWETNELEIMAGLGS
jgi:hypothetical protein